MSSADTRIKIDNTLDERLKLLEDRVCDPFLVDMSVLKSHADVTRDSEGLVRCEREP